MARPTNKAGRGRPGAFTTGGGSGTGNGIGDTGGRSAADLPMTGSVIWATGSVCPGGSDGPAFSASTNSAAV